MKISTDDAKKDLYIENSDAESTNSLEFDVKANQEANQEEFNIEENEEPLVQGAYSSAYDKNGYLLLKSSNQSTSNVEKMDRVWQCFTSSLLEVKKLGKTPHFVYGKDGMSIWRREKDNNDMKEELVPRSKDEYCFSDILRALDITGGGRSDVAEKSMDFQFIKKDDKSMLQLMANLYTRAIILGMDDRKSNNFVYKYEPKKENEGGKIILYDIDTSVTHYIDNNGINRSITPLFSMDVVNSIGTRNKYFFEKMPFLFTFLNEDKPEVFDKLTKEINERIRKTIPSKNDIDEIVRRTCRKLIRKTDGKQRLFSSKIKEILRDWLNYSYFMKWQISTKKEQMTETGRNIIMPKEVRNFNKKILSIYQEIIDAMEKTTTVLSNYLKDKQKINDILERAINDALYQYNSVKNTIKEGYVEKEMNTKIHQINEDMLEKKRKEINNAINNRLRKQKKLFWDKKGEGCKDGKLLNTRFFLKENAGYIRKINNCYDKMCEQGDQNNIDSLSSLLELAKSEPRRPICACY